MIENDAKLGWIASLQLDEPFSFPLVKQTLDNLLILMLAD